MFELYKHKKHEISIGIAIIKQVIQNIGNPLDAIREAMSNSCAKEVDASYFKIIIFYDGSFGWSFILEDDGIGMDYTGEKDPAKQGRLDKFLNLAYSGVAGLKSDEFGFKGLGSKLMYLCRKLEIDTKTKKGENYKVIVENPYEKLIEKEKPDLPIPKIFEGGASMNIEQGTTIRILGYDKGIKYPEYENLEKLKQYLYFRTLIGYTRPERIREGFPKITLKTPAGPEEEELKLGFPWIKKEGDHVEGQKIGCIDPPIVVTRDDKKGNKVIITLKGGYALKTGEFGMTDYGIFESKSLGLAYAWKGIPYFNLDFNRYKPQGFDLYYKFCRFVIECDNVETDIARSRIVPEGSKEPLFSSAVREAFRRIMETKDYNDWIKHRRYLKKKELGTTLNQRKEELLGQDQKWVYFNGKLLHKEPYSEHDVRALLWKLEGKDGLPFYYFKTLEHTAQRGIDIIAEYQEKDFSEKKLFQSIEVEYILENYSDHDHAPEQTSLIVAWDSKNRDKLTKAESDWKYVWEYMGHNLNVILLRYIPEIEIKTKS
ncbi:MAG TPA: hypothetical protein ENI18_05135 [Candidatus Aminicenantes bacterium]|nr:hypothetical protein [Candidatus Aminicenantes bacterium]